MMECDINSLPVTDLHGVGPALAKHLERLGIRFIADLLFHLPITYQDRTRILPIKDIKHGSDALVQGKVLSSEVVFAKRRSLLLTIEDGSGYLRLRFFYFNNKQKNQFTQGAILRCYGNVRFFKGQPEMVHPEYRILASVDAHLEQTLTPNYPLTDGVSQQKIRQLITKALALYKKKPNILTDFLLSYTNSISSFSLSQALEYIHNPPSDASIELLQSGDHPASKRLAFEELVAHHVSILYLRKQLRKVAGPELNYVPELQEKFLSLLPFSLTNAQSRVQQEVSKELASTTPMLRMIQGDVGSGKTVLAAIAVLQAIGSCFQSAIMAPTDILAEQHFNNFSNWFNPLNIKVDLLHSKLSTTKRKLILADLAEGKIQVLIGTHALFQSSVEFKRLGLIIIDEQHRFGVQQRYALRTKAKMVQPHALILTATPIPRTLAMTLYGDLDISVIDEVPPGRKPIGTIALANTRRNQVINRVNQVCKNGQQAYWVCTLIEESDVLEAKAAEELLYELTEACPSLRIGLVHGRLKGDEKNNVMQSFKMHELDLLVATTVIEVGVDVPNASIMIIENPERLGLAQLHQLRGRVGRGTVDSFCVLLYNPPLTKLAKSRLSALREINSGFLLAEKDLELRGPGEIMGLRQKGVAQLKIADLTRDAELLSSSSEVAKQIYSKQPINADALIQRWLGDKLHYAEA